jgi:hypothetical protein
MSKNELIKKAYKEGHTIETIMVCYDVTIEELKQSLRS